MYADALRQESYSSNYMLSHYVAKTYPDLKLFLDVPPEISAELMAERLNKFSGEEQKDIHERDKDYLKKTYENANEVLRNVKKC